MKFLQISICFLFLRSFGYSQTNAELSGSNESSVYTLVYSKTGEVLQGSNKWPRYSILKTGLLAKQTQLLITNDKMKKLDAVPALLDD
jgi:hypothetical protein